MKSKEPDPLLEWNRLNKENAENAIVSAMHLRTLSHSSRFDKISTWLTAGTGITAGLMITNVSNILPHLGGHGFRVCGAFLALSALFGIAAKFKATWAQLGHDSNKAMTDSLKPILDHHSAEQSRIEQNAAQRQVAIETNINMDRVLREYLKPVPRWVAWLVFLRMRKHAGDPQIGYIYPIRAFYWQCVLTSLQAIFYVAFFLIALCVANIPE